MITEVEPVSITLEPSLPEMPGGSSPVSAVSPTRAAPFVPEFRLIVLPVPLSIVILPSALIVRSPVT